MSLTITSRANTLIGRKQQWRFHVKHAGIISLDALMAEMARSGVSAALPDIARVLLLYRQTVSRLVADGYFVRGPLGDHYLSAIGTARSEGDRFMPAQGSSGHGYRLRFRPDRGVEARIVQSVSFKRDKNGSSRNPHPLELEQICKGGIPAKAPASPVVFCRGEYAKLHGRLLGFDMANESLGVFLIERNGSCAFRCGVYASIKPSLVIFGIAADVPAGDYELVVRTATRAGTIRSGVMPDTVRVG